MFPARIPCIEWLPHARLSELIAVGVPAWERPLCYVSERAKGGEIEYIRAEVVSYGRKTATVAIGTSTRRDVETAQVFLPMSCLPTLPAGVSRKSAALSVGGQA